MKILIVDDEPPARARLMALVEEIGTGVVVAEAENGGQVLERLRSTEVDLVLLDMSMPGISGEDLIARIHGHYTRLPILVLIGVSISSKKTRGGLGLNIAIGLAICVSYIFFMQISTTFATLGNFPPLLAVWFPNIVFAFIAAYLYHIAPK